MPRNVKLFLGVAVAYVLWRLYTHFGFLVFPSASHIDLLSNLSPQERGEFELAEAIIEIWKVVYYVFPVIGLAGLAGLCAYNWARWGLLAWFIFLELFSLIIGVYTYFTLPELSWTILDVVRIWAQGYYFDPNHWTVWLNLLLRASLIVLIFSPNARPWFENNTVAA